MILNVYPPNRYLVQSDNEYLIIVTTQHFEEIFKQINNEYCSLDGYIAFYGFVIDKYCDFLLASGKMNCDITMEKGYEIPKVIHYCWFGGNPLPERYKIWMKTWKEKCPDYEIVEWNEHNYDISKNQYMLQAYKSQKWGFVPDYARLDIIYEHGGVYLDTDVEILQPLDKLLSQKAFAGFQDWCHVALGLGFGSVPHNPVLRDMMDYYEDMNFVKNDGSLNLTPSPAFQTESLKNKGLIQDGSFQKLKDISIYPKVFFSPMNHYNKKIVKNENSYLLHHFDGSWQDSHINGIWNGYRKLYDDVLKRNIFSTEDPG